MDALVSVITPSYNSEKYIGKTIESVISQTYSNWEMIICDDCSKDRTEAIVKSYKDDRIKFIRNEKNSGAAYSRNNAIRAAKGQYIAFVDSDDLWLPDKLEKQINFMQENDIAFSYTYYDQINEHGSPLGVRITGPKKISYRKMLRCNWVGTLTAVYDAEKVGLIQCVPIKKRNDVPLWLCVLHKTDYCRLLAEPLSLYRVVNNSSSHSSKLGMIKYHYKVFRVCERFNPVSSFFKTLINLPIVAYKKKRYRENIRL